MRHETQHWDKIRATVEIISGGEGQTGLAPEVAIQRRSDGFWLASGGGSWTAIYDTNTMSEVNSVDLPGLYEYEIPVDQLDYDQSLVGYRMKIVESENLIYENVSVDGLRSEWKEDLSTYSGPGTAGVVLNDLQVSSIAAAVWDEPKAGHVTAGTFGEGVNVTSLETDSITNLSFAPSAVAELSAAVWDEPVSSHAVANSFGKMVRTIQGLVQGNHRLTNTVYDAEGRLLSGSVIIYPSSADTLADTNAIDTFNLTCTYNTFGDLTSLVSRN